MRAFSLYFIVGFVPSTMKFVSTTKKKKTSQLITHVRDLMCYQRYTHIGRELIARKINVIGPLNHMVIVLRYPMADATL